MNAAILDGLTLFTAVGSGVVGGVFFAFSTFVMRALARLPAVEGIRAMQSINVTVLNGFFLGAFIGTAVAGALLIAFVLVVHPPGAVAPLIGGAACFIVGTFCVTLAYNVPRNDALASIDAEAHASQEVWARYLGSWTAWNHVRTVAAIAAAVLLSAARA